MSAPVHLILDPPQSGVWNMAVDAALLEESLSCDAIFLRLYRWSEATVSLGYFQKASEQRHDSRLSNLPTVRRLSGGGAILHHYEQTYSCCLPPSHPLAQQPSQLYEQIHAVFVKWLSEFGVAVAPRGRDSNRPDEPFLCFLREAAPDLVVKGHKVLGSAQRRRRGAVLQHGSLLLRASEHAPELFGVSELAPQFSDSTMTNLVLAERLAKCLGHEVIRSDLPPTVQHKASLVVTSSCCDR
ncbi:MAG: lipoate--protein ligase [Planctomycetaceae bacterium]|nr:lipoate--protein ligase [Planctomycetaceae bacterium]